MKEYEVSIVETLKKTVTVEAESPEDAKYQVQKAWGKGEYILDVLWSSFFVTLVAKKYRLATMLPFVPRMVCDSR